MGEENYLVVGEDGTHHQIQQFIKELSKTVKELTKECVGYGNEYETQKILQKKVDDIYGVGAFKVKPLNKYTYCIVIDKKPVVRKIMLEMVTYGEDKNI